MAPPLRHKVACASAAPPSSRAANCWVWRNPLLDLDPSWHDAKSHPPPPHPTPPPSQKRNSGSGFFRDWWVQKTDWSAVIDTLIQNLSIPAPEFLLLPPSSPSSPSSPLTPPPGILAPRNPHKIPGKDNDWKTYLDQQPGRSGAAPSPQPEPPPPSTSATIQQKWINITIIILQKQLQQQQRFNWPVTPAAGRGNEVIPGQSSGSDPQRGAVIGANGTQTVIKRNFISAGWLSRLIGSPAPQTQST